MPNIDAAYAVQRFNEFMDALTPPRGLMNNPEAMQREADALIQIVERNTPRDGVSEWIGKVCDWLRENMDFRTWPTGKELVKACRECRPEQTHYRDETGRDGPDEAQIYARKMNSGDKEMGAVPLSCIYGGMAAEIEARGLVSAETMRAYRSAWFFSLKSVYGASGIAESREKEARERHAIAVQAYRDRGTETPQRRDVRVPDKSAPIPAGFTA